MCWSPRRTRTDPVDDDPFQIIPPDVAFMVLCALAVLALIFWPYIK